MPDPLPADRLPARTDAQAKGRYLDFLQKSLSAVHGTAIWLVLRVASTDQYTAFTAPETIKLSRDDAPLYLRATQRYEYRNDDRYEGERKVSTVDYAYTLAEDEDLRHELFSWQWHPGDWPEPHVHIGRRHPDLAAFGKLHIPTGRVAFEQVLKFTLTDYEVKTARPRNEAIDILNESLRRFHAFRTWP